SMPIADWLPAIVRAQARERAQKAGETLFRLGERRCGYSRPCGTTARWASTGSSCRTTTCDRTERFKDSRQLVKLRLMETAPDYEAFVRASAPALAAAG
ncbi:MAG: hypothetical protein P8Z80_14640, partial [Pseudolabrys sp.]